MDRARENLGSGATSRRETFQPAEGIEHAFCGTGCLLEFRDEPAKYLDPAYTPLM